MFDNYHRFPKESPLHDVIAEASKVIPAWGRIVLIADNDSYLDVSRFRDQCKMATLDHGDLELTREEIKKNSALHGVKLTPEQVTSQLQGSAGGTIGGLTRKLKGERPDFGRERLILPEAGNA